MKNDIILAGVGGQGILSIAAIIGMGAIENNINVKQAEVHGMSQRGGDVQSHLRLSDKDIESDLIPLSGADLILSVEPMESLRYVPWLSEKGWIVTNSQPFINIPDYPAADEILDEIRKTGNNIVINANELARDLGTVKVANIVMLGAATPYIDVPYKSFESSIRKLFGRKGEDIVDLNIKALALGREHSGVK